MAKMNIYGCGGAGLNIAYDFLKYQENDEDAGFAKVQSFLIDTSRSNIKKDAPENQIYLFESLDGSGKKRDANYNAISERSREMLHEFKPADINVVIHSASGGSGSVIGPLLVSELVGSHNTIVVIIGSSDSRIETDNTLKTLKSYEMISKKKNLPICAFYYENSEQTPRGAVNQKIIQDLVVTSMFFSGQNTELDKADLSNFLNYPKVTNWQGGFTKLNIFTGSNAIDIPKAEVAVSCVSLINDQTSSVLNIPVEYQAVGFISLGAFEKFKNIESMKLPYHLVASTGHFLGIIDALSKKLKVHDDYRATVVHKSILTEDDHSSANNDGMIL